MDAVGRPGDRATLSVVDGEPPATAPPRLVLPPDWLPIVLVAGDALVAAGSVLGAYVLRTANFSDQATRAQLLGHYLTAVPTVVLVTAFALAVSRQYRSWRGVTLVEQLLLLHGGIGLSTLLLLGLLAVARPDAAYSRLFMVYAAVLAAGGMSIERVLLRTCETRLRRRGIGAVRVLMVGASATSEQLIRRMTMFPTYGYAVCGVADDRLAPGSTFAGVPVLGRTRELPRLVERFAVDRCVLTMPSSLRGRLLELVALCEAARIEFQLVPDLVEVLDTRARAESVDGVPLIGTRRQRIGSPSWAAKRLIDLTVAGWGLVLTAPLLLAIALAIRLTSPGGPTLTRQERVGRFQRSFAAYRFRTTPAGADRGPVVTLDGDGPPTPLGGFLRRSGMDALPQLLNVLKGDMSLVGPRPQAAGADDRYGRDVPRYAERRQVRPGLVGWAEANEVHGVARVEDRTVYDVYYVENWSLGMDLRILLQMALGRVVAWARGGATPAGC